MVTNDDMLAWTRRLLGADPTRPAPPHEELLAAIPRFDSLADLPSGTRVLVRGDVDEKPGPRPGQGDVRLRSMVETLEAGRRQGFAQVVFGHIGRKPEGSLEQVARRLGELLAAPVELIGDWLDEATLTIRPEAVQRIGALRPGSVAVLENTRRYEIERALWKAKAADLPSLAPRLARLANEFAEKVGRVYVNEALSAGSLDASTTIVPAAMDRAVLGRYVAAEFDGPMRRCREAQLVAFSGLKIDKLDDLEAIVDRRRVRMVVVAGSLAMALRKASGRRQGRDVCIGLAEDPAHADKPYYIPAERVEQAARLLEKAEQYGVEIVLPIDFVLADGRVSDTLSPGDQQFDVGPKSSELFAAKVGEFITACRSSSGEPAVAFHNGVFGMFEDPRFENGTRKFMEQLRRLKQAGVEVYVGGGEGGAALEKYGQPDWVTHCFTAGGTVLNALGAQPVPYLLALAMKAGG